MSRNPIEALPVTFSGCNLQKKLFREKWENIYILCNFCLMPFTVLNTAIWSNTACSSFHSVFHLKMLMKWHQRSFVYTVFVCQETINSCCPTVGVLKVNLTSLFWHQDVFDPFLGTGLSSFLFFPHIFLITLKLWRFTFSLINTSMAYSFFFLSYKFKEELK